MKRILFNWWLLTGLAAVLIAVLLALVLPLVAPFMRPWWVRLIVVAAVALVWGVFALVRILKGRKASEEIAAELAQPSAGDLEADALSGRMRAALAGLKTAAGNRRDYLYSRPWYVIIGPPGAGKTTALLNSGIQFPFSDAALKGVGGTRNLDFWFADEAVLVDTAGRYTSQDSEAAADQQGWDHFLKLLRRTRPLQPINGVMVAIGLDELMGSDRKRLDEHAAAVRRRLGELRRTLEVSAPIYVLFTKTDLLAGFSEFFDDLDVEGRRAVLGATLQPGEPLTPAKLLAEFDAVVQSMADRVSKRLQEEGDPRRRSLILGFPSQLASLRARLARFFEGAFLNDQAAPAALRGFYFTSGVQEGAPLDRILSGMAQVYDSAPAPRAGASGRAYFLNRLLKDVVIAEAGLVQDDPRAAARRRSALIAGLAGVAAVSLLIVVLWTISFFQNRSLQDHLLTGSQNAVAEVRNTGVDLVEVREGDPDLEQSLALLRALRDLPRGYGDQAKGGAPILSSFGLFQGGHAKAAKEAYLEALQRVLLPRILLRLERYMQDHKAEPLKLYDPLKVYLMLGGGDAPFDPKAIKAWVADDWAAEALPGSDRAQVRDELGKHLDALLADQQFGRVWPERRAPLDQSLIDSTRAAVQALSLADRAYAILRQKANAAGEADWRADQALVGGDRQAFLNGDAVMQLAVPYFFTRRGFERAYQIGLQTVQLDLEKDLWVMGPDADKASIRAQVGQVKPQVAKHYADDYIAAWDAVVKALQPADYFRNPAALGAFTRQPSPLKVLLTEVRKNTTFGGDPAAKAAAKLGPLAGVVSGSGGVDAGKLISDYFRPLDDYVGDGKTPAPIDDFLGAVKQAASANLAAGVAGSGLGGAAAQGQLANAVGQVATAAVVAPPQLQGFVAQATQSGKGAAVSSAQGAIGEEYARNLAPACHSISDNRYPFYGAALNDATTADLLPLMGSGGQFDRFVRERLQPLLETSGPIWRWRADDPVASALDPTSAEQLQKLAQLRDLMTTGLPIKVEAAGFGGAVTAAEFSAGGATYRFEPNTVGAKSVMWSLSSLPEAHVSLYSGAQEVKRFEGQGVWALFRLMDAAQKENAGPTAIKATFGQGAQFATFKIALPSDKNPFGRGGMWSFRCPAKL
ncbi:MAG: type VI secretion system membrane subunit TssM [Phenylobacterium sp.]